METEKEIVPRYLFDIMVFEQLSLEISVLYQCNKCGFVDCLGFFYGSRHYTFQQMV